MGLVYREEEGKVLIREMILYNAIYRLILSLSDRAERLEMSVETII
jgi:hypothetical protein